MHKNLMFADIKNNKNRPNMIGMETQKCFNIMHKNLMFADMQEER